MKPHGPTMAETRAVIWPGPPAGFQLLCLWKKEAYVTYTHAYTHIQVDR